MAGENCTSSCVRRCTATASHNTLPPYRVLNYIIKVA